jgi:His/Glu/Gln/Arg/opine family amino acid ABC transporter permease subunit
MLDLAFMAKIAPDMASALWMTVRVSVLAVVAAVALGVLLTGLRIIGGRLTRMAVTAFVEFTRGVPPLVHISIVYFLLPQIGLLLSEFWTGVVALMLVGAGYTVEIFRGAVESLGRGQTDAARALGLTRWQGFMLVLLPQAIRRSLPPLTNELANVVKASSLLSVISVNELTKVANDLIFESFVVIEVLIQLTALYLLVVGVLMGLSRQFERRLQV